MNLRAHLRAAFVLSRQFRHDARFVNGVRQRLFAVDVLPEPQRRGGCDGMGVIGGADDDGVDVLLFEQFSEIGVCFGLGEFPLDAKLPRSLSSTSQSGEAILTSSVPLVS